MSNTYFVSRKEVDSQYRPKGYVRTLISQSSPFSPSVLTSRKILQGLSPGLQRARAPFRTRNAITGLTIGAFVFGVWAYSISAVKQDTFEDLDEEAKGLVASRKESQRANALTSSSTQASASSTAASNSAMALDAKAKEHQTTGVASLTGQMGLAAAMAAGDAVSARDTAPKGILASRIASRYPSALDPTVGTFVWGAPSVDRIGRTGDRGRLT